MLFEQIRGKQRCTAKQSRAKAKSAIQKPIKQTKTHWMNENIYVWEYILIYICIRIFTYACILYMIIYFGFVLVFFLSHAYIHIYIYILFKIWLLSYVCIVWIAIYEISLLILCTCLFFKATTHTHTDTHTYTYPLA